MNKRGLSSLVSNVLIILFVVMGISVIAIFIFNSINNVKETTEFAQKCMLINLEPKSCNIYSNGITFASIGFDTNINVELEGVRFSFVAEDSSKIEDIDEHFPNNAGSQGYYFWGVENSEKIEVFAVLKKGDDKYFCPQKTIECQSRGEIFEGKECNFKLKIINPQNKEVIVEYSLGEGLVTEKCNDDCDFSVDSDNIIKLSAEPVDSFSFYDISFVNPSQGISTKPITSIPAYCREGQTTTIKAVFN